MYLEGGVLTVIYNVYYRSGYIVVNITEGERLYFSYNTATHVKLTIHKVKTSSLRNIFKIPKSDSNYSNLEQFLVRLLLV